MSAASLSIPARARPRLEGWRAPVVLLAGLAGIVAARWWATRAGLDPLAIGAAFGAALAVLAVTRPGSPLPRARRGRAGAAAGLGIVFGLVLVVVVLVAPALSGSTTVPGLGRPAAPFVPWAMITILVASGEEALLRGRLFDALRNAGGLLPAIVVTTIAFALMHVPLYGWHVVPLDLAVGLAFAGLRLLAGSIAAPAAAHAVADLASWWVP